MKLAVGSDEKTHFTIAREILDAWFNTPPGTDPADVLAVEQVAALENKYARAPNPVE